MADHIPVNEPLLRKNDFNYVKECLETGWISSSGKFIDEFEEKWASFCHRKYGVAVSNGTVALELAVRLLSLKPGDEIIMPTFTIISCALAIIRNGAVPVLVDSNKDAWTMDVSQIEGKITARTKAIMVVHIYGHPVDMDPILKLAEKYNLQIIEDAAEAHGAEYLTKRESSEKSVWKRCGGFGTVSIFSFYANKPITTGEGGMMLTDSKDLADKCRCLRNLCFLPERRFYHEESGYNYRFTNLQAALGVAQLMRIEEIIKKKKWIGQQYTEKLQDISKLQLPREMSWAKSIYWMYGIVLSDKCQMTAEEFSGRLEKEGIETRPFFWCMHEQPVFKKMGLFKEEKYPIAERLARRGLYLPSGLTLSKKQIDYICKTLHKIL